MRKRVKFSVEIDEKLDELFGNCTIYAIRRKRIIGICRTHIPLNELTKDRVHQEIQRIVMAMSGEKGIITSSRGWSKAKSLIIFDFPIDNF